MSASTDLSAKYQENLSQFANSSPASNVARLFGPPKLIGGSLDSLVSTDDPSAASIMPGIALGDASASANQAASQQQQPPQYYLAYEDKDKVLWFQVQVTPTGDEIVTSHGWKDKQEGK
ncbi:hypothetical protein LPJ56_006010 [Coemansia sp. RSA 2599]|nr:hypothetical protein LPJ75_006203 [Coemansia sp. RSA 2598]KAJ1809186.1 hypothetical protein LPJ56_006010 [Coemansia sp. RSA 2599]